MTGAADSPLSPLAKEPLGLRHALHASQTGFSPFLWTLGVYKWAVVGAGGRGSGVVVVVPSHRPTSSLRATGWNSPPRRLRGYRGPVDLGRTWGLPH